MSRSMSYSRYFKIATPMAAGKAASPTRGTGEPIRTPSRIENRHRGAAGQPLQLLAALTPGTPPAEHLAGHERQADGRDRGQDREHQPRGRIGQPAPRLTGGTGVPQGGAPGTRPRAPRPRRWDLGHTHPSGTRDPRERRQLTRKSRQNVTPTGLGGLGRSFRETNAARFRKIDGLCRNAPRRPGSASSGGWRPPPRGALVLAWPADGHRRGTGIRDFDNAHEFFETRAPCRGYSSCARLVSVHWMHVPGRCIPRVGGSTGAALGEN